MSVFLHGAAATPRPFVEALARHRDLSDVSRRERMVHTERFAVRGT